jgi:uncharacterized protein
MSEPDSLPWWRYGHVWLIISGPLAVVVAACVTGWIALRYADPVLAEDYYRQGIEINRTLARDASMAPALQARNHAQTGGAAPLAVAPK